MSRTMSFVWVLLPSIALALAAGYHFGQAGAEHAGHEPQAASPFAGETAPSAQPKASGARVVLYYRNPMGLPDTSPTPKKDSMGMDYIPVYADEQNDEAGTVRVSPARIQTLGVRTAPVVYRPFEAPVRAVGRVVLDERRIHDVSPRFEGWIERLHVSAVGDPVRRGQPLFTAYSPEVASARQELAIAQQLLAETGADAPDSAREGAQALVQAAQARLQQWQMGHSGPISPAGLGHTRVFVSPTEGVVLEKQAVEGMRFAAGTPLYRLADLGHVWVLADVYEPDLARVALGQTAQVRLEAYPERVFEARITLLYPTLNTATRTTSVRLELPNEEGLLRPGLFAHVDIMTGGPKARQAVPDSAIIDDGQKQYVLIAEGEGRFRPQTVETGLRDRAHVEVLSGLKGDEQVVVSANFLIDAESALQAALAQFLDVEKPVPQYETQGAFEDFFEDSGTVMLMHEPVAALSWPKMTMEFGLADPELVKGLLPGTPIQFVFEDRGLGEFVVTAITPLSSVEQ